MHTEVAGVRTTVGWPTTSMRAREPGEPGAPVLTGVALPLGTTSRIAAGKHVGQ